jgi:uncharacterized protein
MLRLAATGALSGACHPLTRCAGNHYHSPLMSKALPERVYPFRLARHGETLEGSVAPEQMPRLAELLHDRAGRAEFELRFGHDDEGQASMLGRIGASLVMLCQRCLEPMQVDVECEVRVALVHEDAEVAALDVRYEPLKVGEEPVSLPGLVEDELLLAVPNFSRHPRGECEVPAGADVVDDAAPVWDGKNEISGESAKENPFSILKSLKSRKPS